MTERITVAVLGAGTMGEGIAQVAATAGHPVLLYDVSADQTHRAINTITSRLERSVAKQRITATEKNNILQNLQPTQTLDDCDAAGLVIEAVIEDLDVKRELLNKLESICPPDAILATNTSSIDLNTLAASMNRPQCLVGMHFFNPAPVMALVEVVQALETSDDVIQTVYELSLSWGKHPVCVKSSPGFIVNRAARPYYAEAQAFLKDQGTDPATLDAAMRDCGGFRMGPLELGDLIGHDVSYAVTRQIWESYHYAPRFEPSLLQKALVDSGRLGRKSGIGFYNYQSGKIPVPHAETKCAPPKSLIIEGVEQLPDSMLGLLLNGPVPIEKKDGTGLVRMPGGLLMGLTDGRTATERGVENGAPFACYDLCLDYQSSPRIVFAVSEKCPQTSINEAIGLMQALGKEVSMVRDLPGMLMTRTIVMLINEAAMLVQEGTAEAQGIDEAMRYGVNYPRGPFEWAHQIGIPLALSILEHLHRAWGERCRPCPLLRQKAQSGEPFY